MSTGAAIVVAITFVWLGMVLAISFLEAPLKFRAPNMTLQRLSVGVVAAGAPPAPVGPGCRSHPVPQQRQDQPWVCSPTSRDG